ncbi:2-C-methyl-D-erythritol 4-phosphate cytidylyltransferase [Enterococcus durans]|uniref:IspD/TarI family cytidylyltransferase n=1 Tax=Enterococcus durans TaxID=53345 RepID=UPI001247677A|nr:IspD/TarI family cytidylyltransferase [Enterococcus durans]KAA9214880.1 2-C-methyl-D-erythritol 4-phosphate cytidylyltransferase [Enterococcus durans]
MNIALLTASGTGTRTGQDIPKQFLHVNNIPILVYTLRAFQEHPEIDEICVVILKGWEEMLTAYAKQFNITKLKYIVPGGDSGQESIYNGLKEIYNTRSREDVVLIHDGNRPMVSKKIVSESIEVFKKNGNAVTVIPCTEVVFTLTEKEEKSSLESLNRDLLVRTQTPHTYQLGEIMDTYKLAEEKGITNMAASCQLMQVLGKRSYFSKGSEKNLKITTLDDLEIFKALLNSSNDEWIK